VLSRTRNGPVWFPACSGEPDWTLINVDSYSSKMMLTIAAAAQLGDVHLSQVIELSKGIISGKLL
jgi:hypothetical protein